MRYAVCCMLWVAFCIRRTGSLTMEKKWIPFIVHTSICVAPKVNDVCSTLWQFRAGKMYRKKLTKNEENWCAFFSSTLSSAICMASHRTNPFFHCIVAGITSFNVQPSSTCHLANNNQNFFANWIINNVETRSHATARDDRSGRRTRNKWVHRLNARKLRFLEIFPDKDTNVSTTLAAVAFNA